VPINDHSQPADLLAIGLGRHKSKVLYQIDNYK
jgi:hypothetical protein